MACVPANTTGFPRTNSVVASITAFAIAKYEVTYADWSAVKAWSAGNGYSFVNNGTIGNSNTGSTQQPATSMNWREMIVWCNAASQESGLTPVYYTDAGMTTPLKVATTTGGINAAAGSEDNPYVNWSANGFRLATGAEWEYAFRYLTSSSFTPDTAPSGWVDSNSNATVDDPSENDPVGWSSGNSSATQPVGGKLPNALGIYDMSGNAYELVWDWNGAYSNASPYTDADSKGPNAGTARDVRGGSYGAAAIFMVGNWHGSTTPNAGDSQRGFRVVRRP